MDMKRPTFSFKKLIPLKSWKDITLLFSMWLDNSRIKGITGDPWGFLLSISSITSYFRASGKPAPGAPSPHFPAVALVKKVACFSSPIELASLDHSPAIPGDFDTPPKLFSFSLLILFCFLICFVMLANYYIFNFYLHNVIFIKFTSFWKEGICLAWDTTSSVAGQIRKWKSKNCISNEAKAISICEYWTAWFGILKRKKT